MTSTKPVTLDQIMPLVGTEIGVSSWHAVTQDMIDMFAQATNDHQFIHVDPVRAEAETPYRGTIAHGFLIVSLLPALTLETLPPMAGVIMSINHGFERLRFQSPVRSGARIRARFVLAEMRVRPSGMVQVSYDITVEVEASVKPAMTCRWLTIAVMERQEGTS